MREQRRLAAIVSADVAGYSRLMGRDESGTLAALKAVRQEVVDPAIAAHGGRIVKTTGDGLLLEFSSVVNAVRCAIEVQTAMADRTAGMAEDRRITFRIGINLGDIIVEGDDIFGDGVNIAARLQEIAPPGGICISSRVHDHVRDRLDTAFDDGGMQTLKNIARPVQLWCWQPGLTVLPEPTPAPTALPLPDKPSIAVLPFENMSGDPEQEYFTDGMVEDIITGLSRSKYLFVIARNSSFAYKGRTPDIRQVGRELGVRYVLEGSVRKSGSRVRISGQLIDAATSGHIWADRFDGDLENIFELQDQMTSSVIGGILPSLDLAEMERAKRKTENLKAYDYYLRSVAAVRRSLTPEASMEGLANARKSVELDPEFALGHTMIAFAINTRWSFRWTVDHAAEAAEAEHAILRALALDDHDPRVLAFCGQTLFVVLRRGAEAAAHLTHAVRLDPNLSAAWTFRAAVRIAHNEPEAAIDDLERAMRLSPIDTGKWYQLTLMARAHNLSGKHQEALAFGAAALRMRPNFPHTVIEQIVANTLGGHIEMAREVMIGYRAIQPKDRVSNYNPPHLSASSVLKYREALRLAGMPD
ncbi:TolB amino-terminal domain-containing protein [Rhodospirillales bacterium URHD0017]|nr:TolB amino-terminal domain-containing protein [Rhodospirillales bacterium URHD0017]